MGGTLQPRWQTLVSELKHIILRSFCSHRLKKKRRRRSPFKEINWFLSLFSSLLLLLLRALSPLSRLDRHSPEQETFDWRGSRKGGSQKKKKKRRRTLLVLFLLEDAGGKLLEREKSWKANRISRGGFLATTKKFPILLPKESLHSNVQLHKETLNWILSFGKTIFKLVAVPVLFLVELSFLV